MNSIIKYIIDFFKNVVNFFKNLLGKKSNTQDPIVPSPIVDPIDTKPVLTGSDSVENPITGSEDNRPTIPEPLVPEQGKVFYENLGASITSSQDYSFNIQINKDTNVWTLQPENVTFSEPVIVTLPVEENKFISPGIFRLDETNNIWLSRDCNYDGKNITFETDHFSNWTVNESGEFFEISFNNQIHKLKNNDILSLNDNSIIDASQIKISYFAKKINDCNITTYFGNDERAPINENGDQVQQTIACINYEFEPKRYQEIKQKLSDDIFTKKYDVKLLWSNEFFNDISLTDYSYEPSMCCTERQCFILVNHLINVLSQENVNKFQEFYDFLLNDSMNGLKVYFENMNQFLNSYKDAITTLINENKLPEVTDSQLSEQEKILKAKQLQINAFLINNKRLNLVNQQIEIYNSLELILNTIFNQNSDYQSQIINLNKNVETIKNSLIKCESFFKNMMINVASEIELLDYWATHKIDKITSVENVYSLKNEILNICDKFSNLKTNEFIKNMVNIISYEDNCKNLSYDITNPVKNITYSVLILSDDYNILLSEIAGNIFLLNKKIIIKNSSF